MKKQVTEKDPMKESPTDREPSLDEPDNRRWQLIAVKAYELYEQRG